MNIEAEEKKPYCEEEIEEEIDDESPVDWSRGKTIGLIAAILSAVYALYIIQHFYEAGTLDGSALDTLTGYLATLAVTPHILCATLAPVFGFVGVFEHRRWAVLVAGMLMTSAAVLFLMYAELVVVQAALFFISYARMVDC